MESNYYKIFQLKAFCFPLEISLLLKKFEGAFCYKSCTLKMYLVLTSFSFQYGPVNNRAVNIRS